MKKNRPFDFGIEFLKNIFNQETLLRLQILHDLDHFLFFFYTDLVFFALIWKGICWNLNFPCRHLFWRYLRYTMNSNIVSLHELVPTSTDLIFFWVGLYIWNLFHEYFKSILTFVNPSFYRRVSNWKLSFYIKINMFSSMYYWWKIVTLHWKDFEYFYKYKDTKNYSKKPIE